MTELTFDAFKECISDFVGIDVEEMNPETDIYEDLCLDSLGLFGLGSHITDTFKRSVPLSLVASVSKLGEMYTLLNEKGTPVE